MGRRALNLTFALIALATALVVAGIAALAAWILQKVF